MEKLKFNSDFVTMVPTACLIEDYQMLQRVLRDPDLDLESLKDEVCTVMECLAENIHSFTVARCESKCAVKPTVASIVAMGCENGVICNADGSDIRCAAGAPVSGSMECGCFQCDEKCPHLVDGTCDPQNGLLKLENGFVYDGKNGEELLNITGRADLPMKTQYIFGDYILSAHRNAFNNKTSWWISKAGHTNAFYCFSTAGSQEQQESEVAYQLQNIDSYKKLCDCIVAAMGE